MEIKNEVLFNIWKDRYCKNDETIDGNLHRVAKYLSSNEKEEKDFFDVMDKGLFFPAGRTMSNSGIGKNLTLNNCFTAPQIQDNLSDIFDKVKLGALTHQKGGGIGYEFSQLRPKGSPTSNDAIASGAVSFMDVFNSQTSTILQGGRRGANMGILSIYSMDIEEFINAKSYDAGKLVHFNVSVMVDDDFMKAVEEDNDIYLHHPVYDEESKLLKDESKWEYKRQINARYLWDLIMTKAYENGEPGIFFSENLNKDNNLWYIENIITTNPCFTEDMKLLTDKGYIKIGQLDGQEVNIVNQKGNITKGKVWCSGEKETISVKFTNNQIIKCTPNHVFMLNDETECEAKNLKGKRIMPYINRVFKENPLYIKLGFIQGDGCTGRINSDSHKGMEVNIGYHDDDIKILFKNELVGVSPSKSKLTSYYLNGFNEILIKLGFDGSVLPERVFPITYTSWDKNKQQNFLHGCYSANGSVITHHRVSYKTTSKVFALQLKKALVDFGITANLTINKPSKVIFSNGEYTCKESYDININKYGDIVKFYTYIGFYQQYKTDNLINLIKEKSPVVSLIKPNGVHKVYDFTEPEIHWGVIEGFIAHNCAEYLAGTVYGKNPITHEDLEKSQYGGACNLGSIFLQNMIDNPFTLQAKFDFNKLKNTTYIAMRLLDNIIDINSFPSPIYENYQKAFRSIGIGITGLGDMLTMLNLKYGSKTSIEFVDKIMNTFAKYCYKASIELAKEKGAFPFLIKEKFIESGYLQKHAKKDQEWKNIIQDIKKHGIRNSKILSVAPTGTMSLTFGQNCSSGLEPIFSLSYDRKVKMGGQSDDDIKIVKMEDYAYKLWKETPNNNIVKEDIFVTAMNLSVQEHLDMLQTIAYHVDMSCSKTINVPTDYLYEDTKKVYKFAWENGIKGCTIFRPNDIRQGVLISKTTENKVIQEQLKRGQWKEKADDTIYFEEKIYIGCGKINLFIGWSDKEQNIQDLYVIRSGQGGCERNLQAMVIAMSGMLRLGGNILNIEKAFEGVGSCNSFISKRVKGDKLSKGGSCGTAILNAIKNFLDGKNKTSITENVDKISKEVISVIKEDFKEIFTQEEKKYLKDNGEISFALRYHKCPICGTELESSGGCMSCAKGCGWSKCE